MFFLGLLSSPIPYFLLAGFYILGFAAGMFRNDQQKKENVAMAVVSVQADIQKETALENTVFVQIYKETPKHFKSKLPDVREPVLRFTHRHITETLGYDGKLWLCNPEFTNVLFSRPPPHFSV